jgi:hypothetical protein
VSRDTIERQKEKEMIKKFRSCRNNADRKDIEGHHNYSLKERDH